MELHDLINEYRSIKPNPAREKESREMLLTRFREMFPAEEVRALSISYFILKPVAVTLVALFILAAGGFGTVALAKNTLPGHFLYPIKRVAEKAQLTLAFSHSKKAVLRAEILTNRLSEVKVLAEKAEKGEKGVQVHLGELTEDFQEELKVLKKEVIAQTPKDYQLSEEELLKDEGALPIMDKRKVFTVIQTDDLRKLLEETKNLLAEKNMEVALEKINDAEKITQTPDSEELPAPENIEAPAPAAEPKVEPKPIFQIEPLQKEDNRGEGSLGNVSTGMMKEAKLKTELIREK